MLRIERLRLIIALARARHEAVVNPSDPEDLSVLCTARPRGAR